MGWYDKDWNDWQYGGNWFKKANKKAISSWRPAYKQPFAAALVQDAWTQRQGVTAAQRNYEAFIDSTDAADFFSVCFEPFVEFARLTSRPNKAHFCKAVLQSPIYQSMRVSTKLDVTSSHVAAAVLGEAYKKFAAQDRQGCQGGGGQDGEPGDGQGDPGKGKGQRELTDGEKDAIEEAASEAIEKAQGELADSQELGNAFGTRAGSGSSSKASQGEIDKFLEIYKDYKTKSWLREIIKFAGRMRHIARARQKGRTKSGVDTYAGVELGDSIERLLPDELAMLDTDGELDMMRRITEGEAQCLETVGSATAGYGPIILAVDESGSMSGFRRKGEESFGNRKLTKYEQAMGIALTVTWIARAQRRWVGLYTFQGGRQTRKLILDPNSTKATDSENLMTWVTTFHGGGTDTQVVCEVIPEDVRKGLLGRVRGKADLLVISDGDMNAHNGDQESLAKQFQAWKDEYKVRVKGLLVGTSNAGMLKLIADENHFSGDMTESSAIAEAVFSL